MGGNVLTWSNDTDMKGIIAIGVPGAGKSEIVKAIANKYGKLCISFNLADMESGIVGSSNEYLRNAQALIDSISNGKVLSIATCNKIDSLSAEIQRRFANRGIFFFDAPTPEERKSIWNIYRAKYEISDSDVTPIDDGWTGAEIKNCAVKAYELNIPLAESAQYIIPVTVSNASTIDALRRNCSGKYLSASYAGSYQYQPQQSAVESQESPFGRKMR
jgi:SpoVK/Ycf46/Vps4 family AAA+-type ATPase